MSTSSSVIDLKPYKIFRGIAALPNAINTDTFVVLEVEGRLIPICFVQCGVDHMVLWEETPNPASNTGEVSGKAEVFDVTGVMDLTILSNHTVLTTWDGREFQDYILQPS